MGRKYSQSLLSNSGDIRPRIKGLKIYDTTSEVFLLNLEMRNNLNIENRHNINNSQEPKKLIFK